MDSIEDGVYIVNQQNDIEYVNPVLKREFGSFDGKKCYEYFHALTKVCPWCKNQEVFAGKSVRWEWYSFKNKKTYDLIDTPLKNPDGSISKLEIFRDITEIKKKEEELEKYHSHLEELVKERTAQLTAGNEQLHEEINQRKIIEKTLRESETKYRTLMNSASDAILLADEEGNLLEINKKAEMLLGYTKEELRGLNIRLIHPKKEIERTIDAFKEIIRKGEGGDSLFEILKGAKNSSWRAGELTKQLLTFFKGGAPIKETSSVLELIPETVSFSLRGSNVKCEYSLADNLFPVEIDKGLLFHPVMLIIL